MNEILSISSWVFGGGVAVWLALALFAPSVLTVAASWLSALSPLIRGASEGLVSFAKLFVDGMKDMLDNFASIVFVSSIAVLSAWFFSCGPQKTDCKKCVDDLRKEYKFIKKTPSEKARDKVSFVTKWSLW